MNRPSPKSWVLAAAVASFAAFGGVYPARFTPAVVFSSLALFALMRLPLVRLPFAAVEAGNAAVSARRIGASVARLIASR